MWRRPTVWILISWIRQKPADLDIQYSRFFKFSEILDALFRVPTNYLVISLGRLFHALESILVKGDQTHDQIHQPAYTNNFIHLDQHLN